MSEGEVTDVKKAVKKGRRVSVPGVIAGVVIVGLVVFGLVMYNENAKLRDPNYATEQAKNEAMKLKDRVGQKMTLPDEEATVATIQDAGKLEGQDFFKDARNGDKVLIFTGAKKAVIYREAEDKIINVGPIVINSTAVEGAKEEK